MEDFRNEFPRRTVFDDFLTITMCVVTQNPLTNQSHYENLYLETMSKYKNHDLRHQFPKLFAQLVVEMDENLTGGQGNDILGNYYELHFCEKNSGQFFTPNPICEFMAQILCGDGNEDRGKPLRVLDPTCGSGRMLISASKNLGPGNEYYGIDIDHTCVKMTAINLFFNGRFHSEVMWGDALSPVDFRMSYSISFLPLGIFRIEDREKSKLWHLHKKSFAQRETELKQPPAFISQEIKDTGPASQLVLF